MGLSHQSRPLNLRHDRRDRDVTPSRSWSAMLTGVCPWFAATGHDFAVVMLTPDRLCDYRGGAVGGAVHAVDLPRDTLPAVQTR